MPQDNRADYIKSRIQSLPPGAKGEARASAVRAGVQDHNASKNQSSSDSGSGYWCNIL